MATQPFKPSGPDSPTGRIPRTIGLAGGTGKMGMMFKRLFEADGQTVLVAGRSTSLTFEELARRSDVVIVSVPISHTGEVIQRIAPLLNPDQLFSDFTSIKSAPVAAMLKSAAQVVGCHPIFGPMGQPEGQNVVLCPARPGDLAPWYREFFTRHGMRVHEMTPAEHDEAMGVIQGLTHFINIAFAKTLETRGVDLQRILNVCSPVYRVTFAMLSRILSGDPALY
ncbi:MAG: prephenate dehydrogenase/arogenate dehydrogenase family protein, partial [Deltaproteobacteria bacterium]|nr:prephenate dehydrogenase/arogenate dehydrogenase family protein [Deltaproteobacteria bacterium]